MYNLLFIGIIITIGCYLYYTSDNEETTSSNTRYVFCSLLVILVGLCTYLHWKSKSKKKYLDSQKNKTKNGANNKSVFSRHPMATRGYVPLDPASVMKGNVNIPSDTSPFNGGNTKIELINYYANWCPASTKFIPTWRELGNAVRIEWPFINVREVICENEEKNICDMDEINEYPTIILSIGNRKIKYIGSGNMQEMMVWINNNIITSGLSDPSED